MTTTPANLPTHYEIGATYRDIGSPTRPATGFTGRALPPDKPTTGKVYQLLDEVDGYRYAVTVGPHQTDADRWIVVLLPGPDVDVDVDVDVYSTIDRALLNANYPRVGLHCDAGPKGAPERRYFDISDLEYLEGADTSEED